MMIISRTRTFDSPESSAERLLDRFAGDLATVDRYIVDEELAQALRHDDYDSYLYWRRIKSICAGLAAERRLAEPPTFAAVATRPAALAG